MNRDVIYDSIKATVHSCLPQSRVLLFGSRARGDNEKNSDYDLMVITPNQFTQREKIEWSTKIDWAIVKALRIPVDILLFSEEEVQIRKEWPGHIIRSAIKEGIAL